MSRNKLMPMFAYLGLVGEVEIMLGSSIAFSWCSGIKKSWVAAMAHRHEDESLLSRFVEGGLLRESKIGILTDRDRCCQGRQSAYGLVNDSSIGIESPAISVTVAPLTLHWRRIFRCEIFSMLNRIKAGDHPDYGITIILNTEICKFVKMGYFATLSIYYEGIYKEYGRMIILFGDLWGESVNSKRISPFLKNIMDLWLIEKVLAIFGLRILWEPLQIEREILIQSSCAGFFGVCGNMLQIQPRKKTG